MAQIEYFQLFRIGESHRAESMIQARDGSFLLAGWATTAGKSSGVVVTIGPQGWQKTYGTGEINLITAITQTSDADFVFTGTHFVDQGSTSAHIWVVKLDKAGNVLWEKIIGDNDYEQQGHGVTPCSDGGVVVVGIGRENVETARPVSLVSKFDARGDLVWQQRYTGGSTFTVGATRDGGYVLCGVQDREQLNSPVYLLRLRSDGKKVWERVYNQFKCYQVQKCAILPNRNCEHLLVLPGFAILANDVGNVIWSRTTGDLQLWSVAQFADQTYALGGNLINRGVEHAYFAVLSKDGHAVLWDNTELAINSSLASVVADDHGNVAAGGTWSSDMGGRDGLFLAIYKRAKALR